jgi:hypothetical protein
VVEVEGTMKRLEVDPGCVMYQRAEDGTWWLDLHQDGNRKRFSLKTRDERKAREIARGHSNAMLSGTWNVGLSGTPVKTIVDKYVESSKSGHAEGTRNIVRLVSTRFLAWCERERIINLDRLSEAHVENYIKDMKAEHGWKNPTANRELAWLKAFGKSSRSTRRASSCVCGRRLRCGRSTRSAIP